MAAVIHAAAGWLPAVRRVPVSGCCCLARRPPASPSPPHTGAPLLTLLPLRVGGTAEERRRGVGLGTERIFARVSRLSSHTHGGEERADESGVQREVAGALRFFRR